MKLVTYNIQYGRGRDGRFDLERIAAAVAGADVIALQEVERFWQRSGMEDQPARLAALLGDYHWVYGAGLDVDASYRANGGRLVNRRRQFGNMLLSRSPIHSSRTHLLPKYASLGPMSLQRCAVEGVLETPVGWLRVYSVHLTHLSAETRMPQLERLLDIHRLAPFEGGALSAGDVDEEWIRDGVPPALPPDALLMGDFNFEPDSEEYQRVVGPLSPYGGRVVNPLGLVDAWVHAGHGELDGVTADIRGRGVRLDYCFASASLRERIRDVRIDTAAGGSDHQPVWVEIA
ncbi:MAG: endonuclease/exonuclease/phosphatase family protein [Gammaproteobacteria bacterium]|nr:endonuclease/exonuclease/phosphatase family protein [Gammaproteobacteria bacterium]